VGKALVTFPEYVRPKNAAEIFKTSLLVFQYGDWKPTHNRQMKNFTVTVIWFLQHLQTEFQLYIYVSFFT